MESLKDRINRKREEIGDRTYDSQRDFAETDEIAHLREEVKTLTARVDDANHRINYHEAEVNELDAALDILIEAVELAQLSGRTAQDMCHSLAGRLVKDEEKIGIDDENDGTEFWSIDNPITARVDQIDDIIDEFKGEVGLGWLRFDKKIDNLHTMMQRELDALKKE